MDEVYIVHLISDVLVALLIFNETHVDTSLIYTLPSTSTGIDSISMDMKDKKLTVVGDVDPVSIAYRLRKFWKAEISKVELAKEPDKKKDEPKKGGDEKDKAGPKTTPYIVIPSYVQVTEDNYPQCCVIC